MYKASKKTISWIVLLAFSAHLMPMPLYAKGLAKTEQVRADNRRIRQQLLAQANREKQQKKLAENKAKIPKLIEKIDKRADKGIEIDADKNSTLLERLNKLSGNDKLDPLGIKNYLDNGGKAKPKAPESIDYGSDASSSTGSGGSPISSSGGLNSTESNSTPSEPPKTGDSGNTGDQRHPPSNDKKAPPGGESDTVAKPLFYPMCLFVDIKAGKKDTDMDKEIKQMIEWSLECDVNLVVFPRWVNLDGIDPVGDPEIPSDPRSTQINKLASVSCNINEALGVKSSSVSTCDRDPLVAAEMCASTETKGSKKIWNPDVAGCAQVHAANGGGTSDKDLEKLKLLDKEKLSKFNGGPNEAVPSIEKKDSCTAGVIAHESQGHSQFGKPNGSNHGNGIGDIEYGDNGEVLEPKESPGFNGWSKPIGCKTMKENSFHNDGRYRFDPKKNEYMIPGYKRILDIQNGEKVLKISQADGDADQDNGKRKIGNERVGVKNPKAVAGDSSQGSSTEGGERRNSKRSGKPEGHPKNKKFSGGNSTRPSAPLVGSLTDASGISITTPPTGTDDPTQRASIGASKSSGSFSNGNSSNSNFSNGYFGSIGASSGLAGNGNNPDGTTANGKEVAISNGGAGGNGDSGKTGNGTNKNEKENDWNWKVVGDKRKLPSDKKEYRESNPLKTNPTSRQELVISAQSKEPLKIETSPTSTNNSEFLQPSTLKTSDPNFTDTLASTNSAPRKNKSSNRKTKLDDDTEPGIKPAVNSLSFGQRKTNGRAMTGRPPSTFGNNVDSNAIYDSGGSSSE